MTQPSELRDIRTDLKIRLDRITARRDEAQRRYERELEEIKTEEAIIREMIRIEEKRTANGHAPTPAIPSSLLRPGVQNRTEHEILELLSDEREHSHRDIKEHLLRAGIGAADDPNFGRSLQGTLLSLRGREFIEIPEGKFRTWRIRKGADHSLNDQPLST